jgi:serine protease
LSGIRTNAGGTRTFVRFSDEAIAALAVISCGCVAGRAGTRRAVSGLVAKATKEAAMRGFDRTWRAGLVLAALGSCATDVGLADRVPPTFEEFEASAYREPWDGGVYIVNGDTPIVDRKALRAIWEELAGHGALAVDQTAGVDARWNASERRALRYCVSDRFGARKAQVVAALAEAADRGWERFADVDFIHVPAEDARCTTGNTAVVFDVSPVSRQPYLARAFFPGAPRRSRNLNVDLSAFAAGSWPLAPLLAHELGHALGFRHEHTRPEAGVCYEDDSWRPLTPYDPGSIMHYPDCNGSNATLRFSQRDADGARALYGPPGGGGLPPPPAPVGTPRTASERGTIGVEDERGFGPYLVVPGSLFRVDLTGTGDLDLYVRFGAAPTLTAFDCRPYLEGSDEACALDVPAAARTASIVVHGYTAGSFGLEVAWLAPVAGGGGLVLNEILADPPAGYDANGDGASSPESDELVELVNASGAPIDLGGATIADATGVRATLPAGLVLAPGRALVVFGGGQPTGFPARVTAITAGPLRLNNGGDTVTIRARTGALLAAHTYGGEAGHDQSLVRAVDGNAASPWVPHGTRSSRPASPGTRADGSVF